MNNTLFGVVGLTLGFLTPNQLSHSLYIQEIRRNVKQTNNRLGEICVELGYLTAEQVEFIVERSRVLRMAPYMAPQTPIKTDAPSEPLGEEAPPTSFAKSSSTDAGGVSKPERTLPVSNKFDKPYILELVQKEEEIEGDVLERYRELKVHYETAVDQVTQLSEMVHSLRERELELAIRAETAEYELSEVRQRLQNIEAAMNTPKPKATLMRVFGRQ